MLLAGGGAEQSQHRTARLAHAAPFLRQPLLLSRCLFSPPTSVTLTLPLFSADLHCACTHVYNSCNNNNTENNDNDNNDNDNNDDDDDDDYEYALRGPFQKA